MNEELKIKLKEIIKTWAKNNMCASCYSDMEVFVDTMGNCIDSCDTDILNDCVSEVKYFGITVDEDVYVEIDTLLKKEAKYWLNDYYKHRKDYDPEVVEVE